jgi:hypothetical protein
MPTLDIFNNDPFSVASLTAAINEQDYVPGRIGEIGLFQEDGVTTTTVEVENSKGALSLVPAGQRGEPAKGKTGKDDRSFRMFKTVHLKEPDSIRADEIQNMRAFGSESETEAVEAYVAQRQAKAGRKLEATLEHLRIGAIKGKLLDADGVTVIYDLYSEFGITQQSVDFVLGTDATKIKTKVVGALRKSEDSLGGGSATEYRAFCGDDFFDAFVSHPVVERAYERYQDGGELRSDSRGGFAFAGVIWENYRGNVGGVAYVPTGEGFLVPVGVPDQFITRFAPADWMETANTMGLPKYSKQEPLEMGRGIALENQSNPICLNTRPGSVIRLFTNN